MTGPDLDFVRRVYRTSALVYAIVSVYVWGYVGLSGWLGFSAGTAFSLFSLRLIEWGVHRLWSPEQARQRVQAGRASLLEYLLWGLVLGKYLIFALLVALIVRLGEAGTLNLPAFAGGFAMVHAVIALKAVGAALRADSRSTRGAPKLPYQQ